MLFLRFKKGLLLIVWSIFCLGFGQQVFAQHSPGRVGIGFQAGDPTGLSLQFRSARGMSADILMAWHANDFFFVNVHGLWFKGIDQSGHLLFYYGPGVFVNFREHNKHNDDDDEARIGLSGNFGLSLGLGRFDIFGQITPRLALTPGTSFDLGGGVGARFFF